MADYKHTLNLPTTEFPMKAALAEREPLMLKHWKDMYLYDKIREKHAGNAKFVLSGAIIPLNCYCNNLLSTSCRWSGRDRSATVW